MWDTYVLRALPRRARYGLFWTAAARPRPPQSRTSSAASFSTFSASCVFLYLRSDLVALFLERDSAQEGENVTCPRFKGSKTGRTERGKNCSHLKIICDGL